jgi:hypothetical protein
MWQQTATMRTTAPAKSRCAPSPPPRGSPDQEIPSRFTRALIVNQAAPGEEVWIKGSEIAHGWKSYRGDVWVLTLPNSYFHGYNPYTDRITGDWFTDKGRPHHTGEVYLNGKALLEAPTLEHTLTSPAITSTTSGPNSSSRVPKWPASSSTAPSMC